MRAGVLGLSLELIASCAASVAVGLSVLLPGWAGLGCGALWACLWLHGRCTVSTVRELVQAVHADVVNTGAVDVRELAVSDWASLPSWSRLRPLEQRRLLAAVVR